MLFELLNASVMCLSQGNYAVLTDKAQEASGLATNEEVEIVQNSIENLNHAKLFNVYSQSECRKITDAQ